MNNLYKSTHIPVTGHNNDIKITIAPVENKEVDPSNNNNLIDKSEDSRIAGGHHNTILASKNCSIG